jgi:hypothetical protein
MFACRDVGKQIHESHSEEISYSIAKGFVVYSEYRSTQARTILHTTNDHHRFQA